MGLLPTKRPKFTKPPMIVIMLNEFDEPSYGYAELDSRKGKTPDDNEWTLTKVVGWHLLPEGCREYFKQQLVWRKPDTQTLPIIRVKRGGEWFDVIQENDEQVCVRAQFTFADGTFRTLNMWWDLNLCDEILRDDENRCPSQEEFHGVPRRCMLPKGHSGPHEGRSSAGPVTWA